MKYLINIVAYNDLYNDIIRNPIDYMDTLDLMDSLIPNFKGLTSMHKIEQFEYEADDTTTKALTDLIIGMSNLLPYMERLVGEYNKISKAEIEILKSNLESILVSSAIILYGTFGFDDCISCITSEGVIDLGSVTLNKKLIYVMSEYHISLEQYAYLVCKILVDFRAFIPEYMLDEEDLSKLFNYVDNSNRFGSITQLSQATVEMLVRSE